MPATVIDTFTGANGTVLGSHTSDSGHSWSRNTLQTANMTITSNRLYAVGGTTSFLHSYTPSGTEYVVRASLYCVNGAGGGFIGITARAQASTAARYEFVYNATSGTSQWQLIRRTSSGATTLATFNQTLTAGQTYEMMFYISDGLKACYVDGSLIMSTTDNTNTGGTSGVTGNTSLNSVHLDTFRHHDVFPLGSGASNGTAMPSARFAVNRNLAGAAAGIASIAARMAVERDLKGATVGLAAVAASVQVTHVLAGAAVGRTTPAMAMMVERRLAGAAAGGAATAALLDVVRVLSGASTGVASVAARAAVERDLSGATVGLADVSASVEVTRSLVGASAGYADAVMALAVERHLAGASHGEAIADALLDVIIALGGSSFGVATAIAALHVVHPELTFYPHPIGVVTRFYAGASVVVVTGRDPVTVAVARHPAESPTIIIARQLPEPNVVLDVTRPRPLAVVIRPRATAEVRQRYGNDTNI